MSIFFGAIADDFTGATDLASMLARAGVPVTLRIGVPDNSETLTAFEVIALKNRTIPVEEAVEEARAALRWLRAGGAERVFWKYCSTFDSTPAGNIGPVAEALMADLGVAQTIYCPAFPENGRTVYRGHLFVGDQLLQDSSMKDHPLTPMRDSNLLRLLHSQVRRDTGLVSLDQITAGAEAVSETLAALRQKSVAHVVVDAVKTEDLRVLAKALSDMTLLTGGSALAEFLPAEYMAAGLFKGSEKKPKAFAKTKGQIVLSGSCSQMTRAQVTSFLKIGSGYRLDPLELAKDGIEDARQWLRSQKPEAPKIIYATAAPNSVAQAQEVLGVARAGALVEDALAQLASDARDLGMCQMVVAGGETSGAVTRALDIDALRIGVEIAPGVPWTHAISEGQAVSIALKSGNFGDEDFFETAFSLL